MTAFEVLIAVIILTLVAGNVVQSYFMFRLVQMVAILKSAPDALTARAMLKDSQPKKKKKDKKTEPPEVAIADMSDKGVANLRRLQDQKDGR